MRDWAMRSCTPPWSMSGLPNATRDFARSTMRDSDRSAMPTARIAWWIRPGPSLAWAIMNPSPSPASRLVTGTRTLSKTSSEWPCWSW